MPCARVGSRCRPSRRAPVWQVPASRPHTMNPWCPGPRVSVPSRPRRHWRSGWIAAPVRSPEPSSSLPSRPCCRLPADGRTRGAYELTRRSSRPIATRHSGEASGVSASGVSNVRAASPSARLDSQSPGRMRHIRRSRSKPGQFSVIGHSSITAERLLGTPTASRAEWHGLRTPGARPSHGESGASGAEPPRQRPGTDASVEPSACVGHSTGGRWMGGALRSVPTLGARPAVPEDDPDADPCKCG